jgi:hypothetical protein
LPICKFDSEQVVANVVAGILDEGRTPTKAIEAAERAREVGVSDHKRAPFDQAMQGMKDAVREHELESDDVDLAVALGIALAVPDGMARWLRGERLFALAHLPKNEPSSLRRRLPTVS